jgi:hypothetical protein
LPRLPANVFHRVCDLPSASIRVEVGYALCDEPGRIPVLVGVEITHPEWSAFGQFDHSASGLTLSQSHPLR